MNYFTKSKRPIIPILLLITILLTSLIPSGVNAITATEAETISAPETSGVPVEVVSEVIAEPGKIDKESAVPVLDELPATSTDSSITLSGTAPAGTEVTIWYVLNGKPEVSAGPPIQAADDGTGQSRFSLTFTLEQEGDYTFTAEAAQGSDTSGRSAPVQINVDWSAPGEVQNLTWELLAYNRAQLRWEPPLTDTEDPTLDIAKYVLYSADYEPLTETTETSYTIENLIEGSPREYYVAAVDAAGNESSSVGVTVAPSPQSEVKLTDLSVDGQQMKPSSFALSGDGSTIFYTDREGSGDTAGWRLYSMNTKTAEKKVVAVTADNTPVNKEIRDIDVDRTGNVVVFTSEATNILPFTGTTGSVLYAYNTAGKSLKILSSPSEQTSEPSVNSDGSKVAFTSNNRVFLYDLTKDSRRLVSLSVGSMEEGRSHGPVINGRGTVVAFLSDSPNIQGLMSSPGEHAIYLYDIASETVTGRFRINDYHSHLSISDDGRYIALVQSAGPSWPGTPYLYDRTTGEFTDLNEGRSETEVSDKAYGRLSMSGDARFILAQLIDSKPDFAGMDRFHEGFNRREGGVTVIGNPALPALNGLVDDMGNRVIYTRGHMLYTACLSECGQSGPEPPTLTALWSVPSASWVDGELKPGSEITIQADGEEGQQIIAVISYKQIDGELSSHDLTLQDGEENPGLYSGVYTIPHNAAELTSITVKQVGDTVSVTLDKLPVKVSGVLSVTIETPYMEALNDSSILVTKLDHQAAQYPVDVDTSSYSIPISSGANYKVELINSKLSLKLAEQQEITVNNGRTTAVTLVPKFPVSLHVTVNYDTPSEEPAVVIFKRTSDQSVIAEVKEDEYGQALLPGTFPPGEGITVSVVPPVGYKQTEEQRIQLVLGRNTLFFNLVRLDQAVTEMHMNYQASVLQGNKRIPVIGTEATLIASGKPGLNLQGLVTVQKRKDGAVETMQKQVDMTETSSGNYRGSFTVEDGIIGLDAVTPVADGQQAKSSFPIDVPVAGRIQVHLAYPEGDEWEKVFEQAGVTLVNTEWKTNYSSRQGVVIGKQTYTFDVPYERVPYQVVIRSSNPNVVPYEQVVPAVRYAETKEITLKPRYRVQLSGAIHGEDGKSTEASYELLDGNGIVQAKGKSHGRYAIRFDTYYGEQYRLVLTPSDPVFTKLEIPVTADALEQNEPAIINKKKHFVIQGIVRGVDGKAVEGAAITAAYEGTNKVFQTVSDSNGKYSLSVPQGTYKIRASSHRTNGKLSKVLRVLIKDSPSADTDLQLYDHALIDVGLYTKQADGAWQGPLEVDRRVGWGFSLQTSHQIVSYGPPMRVAAVAGDTFNICADGYRAQLPKVCKEVVIGEDNKASVELRLEGFGTKVYADFKQADGSKPAYVNVQMFRYEGTDLIFHKATVKKTDNNIHEIILSQPGRYRLEAKANGGSTASLEFEASAGLPVDLGIIELHPPGRFGGMLGNSFSTTNDIAIKNGKITAQLMYRNTWAEVEDAEFIIQIPGSVSYRSGTLIVNGKPHDAAAVDGQLIIPVGSIKASAEGSIRFTLQVGDELIQSRITLPASVRYTAEGKTHEESIGIAIVQVAQATLRVPETIVSPDFRVSGVAPGNSTVTIYDGSVLIGTAPVSPEGTWQANVTLADPSRYRHSIRTQVEVQGVTQAGEEAIITYDPNDPGLEEVSMRQPDGRGHTFKTANGVAVFPFVFVPGKPILYELTFRDPARISNVEVWTGETMAEAQLVDGIFKAAVTLKSDPGPIVVTYQKKSDPAELPQQYTEQELRDTMPHLLRDLEVLSVIKEPGQSNSFTSKIKLTEDLDLEVTVRSRPVASYTPTSQDLSQAAESGIPLYGISISKSISDSKATAIMKGFLPEQSPSGAKARRKAGGVAGNAFEIIVDLGSKGAALYDLHNTVESVANPEALNRANRAYAKALKICDERARDYYTRWAEQIQLDIAFSEVIKNGLNWVGATQLSGAPGLLFWAESTWAGKVLDNIVNKELDEIEHYLKQFWECEPPKVKPAKPPVAKPGFIIDPSGYVYEGMATNRIEGVLATALQWNPDKKAWEQWDSEWYEQQNPLLTDPEGRYAWDVPAGRWKVKFEKHGYKTAYSDDLDVPPPQLEINIPMTSLEAPEVSSIMAVPGGSGIMVHFTKPVLADSLTDSSILISKDGIYADGIIQPVEAEAGAEGEMLTMTAEFKPASPLAAGDTYSVLTTSSIVSYAGVPLLEAAPVTVRIEEIDSKPPSNISGLEGGLAQQTASFMWNNPADHDFAGTLLRWKEAGAANFSDPVRVAKDRQWAVIEGLDDRKSYEFVIASVDQYGNEATGVSWAWVPRDRSIDRKAPSAVTRLQAVETQAGKLNVTWTNPYDPDLDKLRVHWSRAGHEDDSDRHELDGSSTSYEVGNLLPDSSYTISVTAIDKHGNESVTSFITVKTRTGSSGPGGPPTGGEGGSPGPEPQEPDDGVDNPGGEAGRWSVPVRGGSFTAFDNSLGIKVKAGVLQQTATIDYARTDRSTGNLSGGYVKLSPTYRVSSDQSIPAQPIELSVQFITDLAKGMDIRRFGIYKKEAEAGWSYVGGLSDSPNDTVHARLTSWGEYAVLLYDRQYQDMKKHWARAEVDILSSRHIVSGFSSTLFKPNRHVTRAEMVKLLVVVLRQQRTGTDAGLEGMSFRDVPPDAWYAPYVDEAVTYGLIKGSGGRFRPHDKVTRQEMVVMLYRLAGQVGFQVSAKQDGSVLEGFQDAKDIPNWAEAAVQQSIQSGWLQGTKDRKLGLFRTSTRAEASVMLLRVMDSLGLIQRK
ncbi:S-layer homology domain-containing protein [Paenibacillus tarimensis]|uniref:S-layer homology domain-containing protein n=1 Tax=Paenibacillus tarimensis TaxID=416012 RepID=UPI001F26A7AF|nr:S-layer homology domain-containing protein [Paenibacillus tarimensis]MCF2945490.1 S-layer homology domain-containing protein [Paenibacillus tarimensis]